MADTLDVELEEDLFILFASTVTSAAAFAGAQVGNLLHLHQQQQHEAERRVARYRPPLLVPIREPFCLDNYTEEYSVEFFRFTHRDIRTLLQHFALDEIVYRYRIKCDPEMALCIVLFRLAAPSRYKIIMEMFQRSRSWLCTVFNDTIEHLVARYVEKLYWDENRLTPAALQRYTMAVENTGGATGVWGFIDGTMRAIGRPNENQRIYYSGYKKYHAIKFQAVTTPDGLISHLAGPWPGHRGDWGVYIASGLQNKLRAVNSGRNAEERFYLYGDPAYALSYGVISSYRARPGRPLDPILHDVNTIMSSLRVSVEHGFSKTIMLWSFNAFRSNLKIGLSPVAAYYIVAVLLTNIHGCIYGNQTSQKFHCSPPSLHDYLA